MLLRVAGLCAFALSAGFAYAEDLAPEQARAFVVGKLFSYTCFDGTVGMGRIFNDGSVVGTIRPMGQGPVRFAALPAGTIKVSSNAMCAHLSGLPFEPCFRVQKLDYRSFRGSLSGLSFAYCDFTQHNPRVQLTSNDPMRPPAAPRAVMPVATQRAPVTPVTSAPATPIVTSSVTTTPAAAPSANATPVASSPAAATPIATTLRPAIEE
jgi:hypothetical protein